MTTSDRMWSTGEGNGKLLQYSCLENPMNSMKRASRNSTKSLFLPQFSHFPWINDLHIVPKLWIPEFGEKKCWSWSFSLTTSLLLWRNTFRRSLPYYSQGKNTQVVCHPLLQWTTFCQPSSPWPACLGWPHRAWLSFIELDKAMVLVWLDWLVFCDYGFSVFALWCPLAAPTVLLRFLLPWTWGISSWLLQQSAVIFLIYVKGYNGEQSFTLLYEVSGDRICIKWQKLET